VVDNEVAQLRRHDALDLEPDHRAEATLLERAVNSRTRSSASSSSSMSLSRITRKAPLASTSMPGKSCSVKSAEHASSGMLAMGVRVRVEVGQVQNRFTCVGHRARARRAAPSERRRSFSASENPRFGNERKWVRRIDARGVRTGNSRLANSPRSHSRS
jgi:hypothetical protein